MARHRMDDGPSWHQAALAALRWAAPPPGPRQALRGRQVAPIPAPRDELPGDRDDDPLINLAALMNQAPTSPGVDPRPYITWRER